VPVRTSLSTKDGTVPSTLRAIVAEIRAILRVRNENSTGTVVSALILVLLRIRRRIRLSICGERILVRTSSPDVRVAVESLGPEFQSLRMAYQCSQEGLILDAGGYIGTAAIALARLYPRATVVTIEPSSENFSLLRENTKSFPNIVPRNAAVLPKRAGGTAELRSRGTGEWGLTVVRNPQDGPGIFVEKVAGVTFDGLFDEFQAPKALIIKMDIEGGEYELFSDDCEWIGRTAILLVELHERIRSGCERAFWEANRGRFVCKGDGEKYLSVGESYFRRVAKEMVASSGE
jgi:FkbM family methyltransferase